VDPELAARIARRDEILRRIQKILIERLQVRRQPDELDPDTPLFGAGIGLDSVDSVELVVSIETEFGLKLRQEEISGRRYMRTINTLADMILIMMEVKERQEQAEVSDALG
jgi:acyl carrier protein